MVWWHFLHWAGVTGVWQMHTDNDDGDAPDCKRMGGLLWIDRSLCLSAFRAVIGCKNRLWLCVGSLGAAAVHLLTIFLETLCLGAQLEVICKSDRFGLNDDRMKLARLWVHSFPPTRMQLGKTKGVYLSDSGWLHLSMVTELDASTLLEMYVSCIRRICRSVGLFHSLNLSRTIAPSKNGGRWSKASNLEPRPGSQSSQCRLVSPSICDTVCKGRRFHGDNAVNELAGDIWTKPSCCPQIATAESHDY